MAALLMCKLKPKSAGRLMTKIPSHFACPHRDVHDMEFTDGFLSSYAIHQKVNNLQKSYRCTAYNKLAL